LVLQFRGFVVLAEHLRDDLGAEALERKSARLGLGGRTGQLTAIQGTDDVVGEFAREREHLLIVAMGLDGLGDLAALLDDLVVGRLLLGGHPPVLGLGLLGDLSGLGQLWADLGDLFGEALFT